MRHRSFIHIVIAATLAATTTFGFAQATAPKTEKALQGLLKKGTYIGSGFKVTAYKNGRYELVSAETERAKKNVRTFLAALGIGKKTTWQIDEMYGEQAMTEGLDAITRLPYETKTVRITWDSYYQKVVIVPKVEINTGRYATRTPQEELAAVWPKYERACTEAVTWLKKQGFSSKNYDLEFWMEDFWPVGKKIAKP